MEINPFKRRLRQSDGPVQQRREREFLSSTDRRERYTDARPALQDLL